MARRYARQTCRPPRKTWTDKLMDCETWEEVVAMPDPQESRYLRGVLSLDKGHLENLPGNGGRPNWPETSHETVERWVEELPVSERMAFDLIHFEGLSLRAAGRQLHVSHETVRVLYNRAVHSLSFIVLGDVSPPANWTLG